MTRRRSICYASVKPTRRRKRPLPMMNAPKILPAPLPAPEAKP